jgi:uncharacterized protein (TIGR03067 family)
VGNGGGLGGIGGGIGGLGGMSGGIGGISGGLGGISGGMGGIQGGFSGINGGIAGIQGILGGISGGFGGLGGGFGGIGGGIGKLGGIGGGTGGLQIIYVFKGDTVTYKESNGQHSGTFRLYPIQRPKAIDMTFDGKMTRAIYKLNDDKLKLSLAGPGESRPVDFSGDGVATVLILMRTQLPKGRVLSGKPVKPTTGEPPVAFANALGWAWFDAPQPRREFGISGGRGRTFGGGYSYILAEDKDGASLLYLAFSTNESILDYRPVAFDAERKRYPFTWVAGGGGNNVTLSSFRLDPQSQRDSIGRKSLSQQMRK